MKRLSGVLVLTLIVMLISTAGWAAEFNFPDVSKTHWAYDEINALVSAGIVKGYPDGTFHPDGQLTRQEFAVFLTRLFNLPMDEKATQTFKDVGPEQWSFQFVEAAKVCLPGHQNPDGTSSFGPEEPVLREDVAAALVKAKGLDKKQQVNPEEIKTMFTDYASVSESYRTYVVLAAKNKIMGGYPDKTFKPQASLNRAEVAAVFSNIMFMNNSK